MNEEHRLHALAWVSWLLAYCIAATTTHNPLYLGLLLLWVALITGAVHLTKVRLHTPGILSPVRFGCMVVPLSLFFNAVNVHIGTTVLFHLPASLPLIGGPITLEAAVYGALNGLVLTTLFAAFAIVTQLLSVRAIVSLIPRAYYPMAVVVTIALTFTPLTLRQFQQIREAQAIRGHRLQGIRSWLPLFLPLLLSGLERALQLAEAMTARGYASTVEEVYDSRSRLTLLIGLCALLSGLFLRLMGGKYLQPGWLLVLVGSALVLAMLWVIGRRYPHMVYRPVAIHGLDWAVILGALLVAGLFVLPLPGIDRSSLFYYPYPTLTLPGFTLPIGIATWGLLSPILICFQNADVSHDHL